MRYLIDTNILIRMANKPDAISTDIWNIIEDTDNLIHVSSVSIQEIFMLMGDNKLKDNCWKRPTDVFDYLENKLYFPVRYVHKEHLLAFANIIPARNHNDPFDRLIIAQAIAEQIPLISSDTKFHHYRDQKLEFIFNDK